MIASLALVVLALAAAYLAGQMIGRRDGVNTGMEVGKKLGRYQANVEMLSSATGVPVADLIADDVTRGLQGGAA